VSAASPDRVLTLRELNRATLARQILLDRERVPAVEAVGRLAGMQAQEPKHPFVGLWTRVAGFRREALHRALHDRSVVRATLMRGTLHLASAEDYLAARPVLRTDFAAVARTLGARAQGLDPDAVLPVARAFYAGGPRTFEEVRDHLVGAFPDVHERALGFTTRMLLDLVMVPDGDRWAFPATARFTPAEDWLGAPIARAGRVEPLVLQYLAAFGPATAADVQTWSGLKGIKPVLAGLRERLVAFRDERGRELFDLPDAPRPDPDTPAPPRFLPEFDNLLLAHADRTRVIADEHRPRVATKNLRVRATFLHDGFVRGTWDAERKREAATLRLRPFEPLPAGALAELEAEGAELLRFLEPDAGTRTVEVAAPVA